MSKTFNYESINKCKLRLATKIDDMKNNGRKEITSKEELEKYAIGSLISYLNKRGIFRTAGYLQSFGDDYFIYLTVDFSIKKKVWYKNVDKMWVGDVYKTKNDLVSIIPSTNKKTKIVAKIGGIAVYYTTNSNVLKRYMHSQKYQRMVKWYEIFGGN